MALDLSLSYSQSNNAVTLTVTDSAGEYTVNNTGGWSGGGNEFYEHIVVSTNITPGTLNTNYHLILDVTVTDKSNVSTTYDTINLWDHNGSAFTAASELTFDFNPAHFVKDSTAMGASTDMLVDGIYDISYKLVENDDHLVIAASVIESIKVDGDVRYNVYNQLRQVSTDYDCEINDMSKEHMDALMSYTYLQSIDASSSVSEKESIISQLYTLDKMVSDGSKYTW